MYVLYTHTHTHTDTHTHTHTHIFIKNCIRYKQNICHFFLSNLSMLSRYKQILFSEQEHKLKHTTHTSHKNVHKNGLCEALLHSINNFHLYMVIAITVLLLFLNDPMGKMNVLHAMYFFIMGCMNCFG